MNLNDIQERELFPGFRGKLIHGERITWAFWKVEQGAELPVHSHEHEQITHVVSGRFEMTLDGETQVYTEGDVILIPSEVDHSGRALTHCTLMDVFSPARDDYR